MNTSINNVIDRIQQQSQGTSNANNPNNLADYIWMLKQQQEAGYTDGIWNELIQDFEILNTVLNIKSKPPIERSLIYAINGLLVLCYDYVARTSPDQSNTKHVLKLAWKIGIAWDAILAGDIVSINEHLELEEATQG